MLNLAQKKPSDKSDTGWFSQLRSSLARTGEQLTDLFGRGGNIDEDLYEELKPS